MTFLFLLLAFVLGVVLTWFWAVRTVHREVPTAVLERVWGERDGAAAVETVRRAQRERRTDDEEPELYDQEHDDLD